jgi:hypothetical protein
MELKAGMLFGLQLKLALIIINAQLTLEWLVQLQ